MLGFTSRSRGRPIPTLVIDPEHGGSIRERSPTCRPALNDDGWADGCWVRRATRSCSPPDAASPVRGQWYGVFLGPNALPSTIQYTQIEWAGRLRPAVTSSIRQTAGSLTLDNVTITRGHRGSGVQVQGGTLTLTDSTFSGTYRTIGGTPGAGVCRPARPRLEQHQRLGMHGQQHRRHRHPPGKRCRHHGNDRCQPLAQRHRRSWATCPAVTVTNNTFDAWGLRSPRG